jgi:hypothetical protein
MTPAHVDTPPARWVTTWVSDCQGNEAAQDGIACGSENDDPGADRERQDMAQKNPALFIPVKVG